MTASIAFRGRNAKSTGMADTDPQPPASAAAPRERLRLWAGMAVLATGLAIALVWSERIDIAHRLIDRQIQQLKLSARYHIDQIGTGREVLSDISLGLAANPDLTVRTLVIDTGWQTGLPAITGVKLIGARLHGTFRDRHLSFGSLDSMLFAPAQQRFRLPDMALDLRDASASIGGDHGAIGIAIAGHGNLRDGFVGVAAMMAPALHMNGCTLRAARFQGPIVVRAEQPRVTGALQMAEVICPKAALAVQTPLAQIDVRLASRLDGGTAHVALTTGAARLGASGAGRLTINGAVGWRDAVLHGDFTATGDRVHGPALAAAQLGVAGHAHGALSDGSWQAGGVLFGRGLGPDPQAAAMLAHAVRAGAGTAAGPLLATFASGIAREAPADRLAGNWSMQRSAAGMRLMLPALRVDGGRTARWLSISQVMVEQAVGGLSMAGDFAVTAPGFPQLRGNVRPLADGAGMATLAMPTWTAGPGSLALPALALHWTRGGAGGFAGRAVLSGPLPGGHLIGLTFPLQGNWSAGRGLSVADRCTAVRFDRLALAGLTIGTGRTAQAVTVCPDRPAPAIIVLNARGLRVSARIAGLSLAGRMNGADLRITTGAAALTWPGALSVADMDISTSGPTPDARLHLARLTASLGAVTTGQFAGGDASLAEAAVRDAAGAFRFAGGRLTIDGGAFRIVDLAPQPAFAPIIAHDMTLAMANGAITGAAALRATATVRELAKLTFGHDLASSAGHAEVSVPGLVFDKALQPRQLSPLAEGVIADAKGTLTGHGSFTWDHGHFASSGRLATKAFDFAAAFGPVKGVSGEIVFTDLIGLVTAPDQHLAIATINPGIEVDDGVLTFALQPGGVLAVAGARWPFLDGELTLLPTRLVLGATEVRRFVLHVEALNAAKFLARMDLSNLAATGTFDGDLPLVFDESGGRIAHGLLLSRAPGGTVSYVGDLTYKDLSPIANYAFQALRALSYKQMRIGMDGALAGDIVTRVSMSGVGQGKGAKRNFITRQIARLPIQFDVRISAPFMQLVTSFRSLYDPAMVADPRTLGLIDAQGRAIAHPAPDHLPAATKPAPIPPGPIQP